MSKVGLYHIDTKTNVKVLTDITMQVTYITETMGLATHSEGSALMHRELLAACMHNRVTLGVRLFEGKQVCTVTPQKTTEYSKCTSLLGHPKTQYFARHNHTIHVGY